MKYLVSCFFVLLLSGCAIGGASGPLCGGAQATVWGVGFLQRPELHVICGTGEGMDFNNSNQTGDLVKLVQIIAELAAKMRPTP